MTKELERIESKLNQHTIDLISRFEFQKMKSFFNNVSPEEGVSFMRENSVTAKDSIHNIIDQQIKVIKEIKTLDLQEESITARVKELLDQTVTKAIKLVKEEL